MSYYYDVNGDCGYYSTTREAGKSGLMRPRGTRNSTTSALRLKSSSKAAGQSTTLKQTNSQPKETSNILRISELEVICKKVESAIEQRLTREAQVVANASKFRVAVHTEVSEVIKELRTRERDLLNRIDASEDYHLVKLQNDLAMSYELLGQLKHAIRCAEDCMNTISCIEMEHLDVASSFVSNETEDKFAYWSDLNEIKQAVGQFGVVDAPLKALQSLGPYMTVDKQQRILSKTLQKLQLTANDLLKKVCIEFPKMSSNKEDWLQNGGTTDEVKFESKFILPGYLLVTDSNSWLKGSQNVSSSDFDDMEPPTWLHRENCDDKIDDKSSFTSESIEMISTVDSVESDGFTCVNNPINSIHSCRGIWLVDTKEQKGAANSDLKTNCEAPMDIENLGNKDAWLMVSRGTNLQIADVCRANETCQAFSDCLCDVSCQERARKWIDEIEVSMSNKSSSQAPWDGMEWLKKPAMMECSSSDEKDTDRWLKKDDGEKMDASEKRNVVASDTKWVTKESVVRFFGKDQSCSWLKNRSVNDTKCQIPNDFKLYFQNTDTKQWLVR